MSVGVQEYDAVVIGGGPGGSVAAAALARGGRRVALLERERFPREKVCGDCLNPLAWETLESVGFPMAAPPFAAVPIREVEFVPWRGAPLTVRLPRTARPELGVRRRDLDAALLRHAQSCGVEVHTETVLTRIDGDLLTSGNGLHFQSPVVIAADGRNSTVARLLGLAPASRRGRVGVQCHFQTPYPASSDFDGGGRVTMRWLPWGYCGVAPVAPDTTNLCLVSTPARLPALKEWACGFFPELRNSGSEPGWRQIAPVSRASISPVALGRIYFVGDSARVVEPFTGEGIAYAIRSGALAAEAILAGNPERYRSTHRALYRGRLWLNELVKWSCLAPWTATGLMRLAQLLPSLPAALTRKVIS